MNVTVGLALLGGLVSFFSPCVLPVVPAYFSFLVGSSIQESSRRVLIYRSLFFVLGFSTVFILLGASASAVGHLISSHRAILTRIGGIIVIIFGLQMTGILNIPWLMMEKRVQLESGKRINAGRAFLLGLSFAAGWTPCIGPVLSSILIMAGSSGDAVRAALLLGFYSAGLAVPFLLFALIAERAGAWIRRSGKLVRLISVTGGLILIILGILLFFNLLSLISAILPVIPLPF